MWLRDKDIVTQEEVDAFKRTLRTIGRRRLRRSVFRTDRSVHVDVDGLELLLRRRRRALATAWNVSFSSSASTSTVRPVERGLRQAERVGELTQIVVLGEVDLLVALVHRADEVEELLAVVLAIGLEPPAVAFRSNFSGSNWAIFISTSVGAHLRAFEERANLVAS